MPEIKVWPGGKNCYTFVCWFKLDLKYQKDRPLSPDTTSSHERYTLYRYSCFTHCVYTVLFYSLYLYVFVLLNVLLTVFITVLFYSLCFYLSILLTLLMPFCFTHCVYSFLLGLLFVTSILAITWYHLFDVI